MRCPATFSKHRLFGQLFGSRQKAFAINDLHFIVLALNAQDVILHVFPIIKDNQREHLADLRAPIASESKGVEIHLYMCCDANAFDQWT